MMPTPSLKLTLLGTFDLRWQAQLVTNFPTDKVRALLAYLALEADTRPCRRESLATLLWPDYPDNIARRNLRQNLHRLKQLLDKRQPGLSEQLLQVSRQTVALNRAHLWLDVAELETGLAAVTAHAHRHLHTCPTCLATLTQLAPLVRGDLLAGFTLPDAPLFDEWLTIQREKLHYQGMQLLHNLTEVHLQRAEFAPAHQYAAQQIGLEPWREEAHRQMMLALARQGQRSEALAQYATCSQILEEELGVSPSEETVALYETIINESLPPLAPTAVSPLHHFPTTFTPFIGRQAECAQIITQLQDPHCRLLTIVAPGGMGKTRLALHAIHHHLHQERKQLTTFFPDGAYFVPLHDATTLAQLITALAHALDLPADSTESQLTAFLHDKKLLLVLDNFEQLHPTAVFLTTLLQNTPHLQLLLTSQIPLGTQAEWLLRLEGLPYPTAEDTAVNPNQYAAVQLFLQAARRIQPQFQADETTLTTIVHICQLVGGMPLALEIAASWLRLLDCAQIAAQISHSLDFLQLEGGDWPTRHRSMRLLLQKAWTFLPPAEQNILAQLAHFTGSFKLEAAQTVTKLSLPTLAHLRDQSWLQRLEDGLYTLHPLIRQFAAEQLAAQPLLAKATRLAHSRHYLQLMQGYGAALHGPQAQAVIQELRLAQPNLVLAWDTAVAQNQWPFIQASHQSYADYHLISGQLAEGTTLLATALAQLDQLAESDPTLTAALRLEQARLLIEQGQLPAAATLLHQVAAQPHPTPPLLARLNMERGHLQELQGAYLAAHADLQAALTYYQASGNLRRQAQTIGIIGNVYWRQNQYDDALDQFYRALALTQDMGDLAYQAILLANIGIIHVDKSDFDQGVQYYQQALSIDTQLGNRAHVARHTHNIARVYRLQGKQEEALDYFQRALHVAEELGLRRGVSLCLTNMGIIHKDLGQHGLAETTYQRSLHIARELNLQDEESNLLGNLGNLYRVMARYEAAHIYYEQALTLARDIGYREGEARHLGNMAETAMLQQDWAGARPWLDEGIKILREIGDIYYISPLLLLQAEALLELGEPACAQTLLAEALTLTEQTGRTDYQKQTLALAARLGISPAR